MELGLKILSSINIFNKYARHIPEENRRENWNEITNRYIDMMIEKYPHLKKEIFDARQYILDKKILPSMRGLQFAGAPIDKNNVRIFNCAFLPIDDYHAFSETLFLLLCGTGVGFSVQKHHINKLPSIKQPTKKRRYLIGDSIEGWADSIKMLMKSYLGYSEYKPIFDYRDIRPKGSKLSSGSGKAPGNEPLKIALEKIEQILLQKVNGEKLKSIEVHDIVCHLADCVLAGGIRRSACISLFNLDDEEMLNCKSGNWWENNIQRSRANNSVILERGEVDKKTFLKLWKKVEESGSGEPGFYWTNNKDLGTNPCCFTGDMRLLTSNGYETFKSLNNKFGLAYNKDMKLVPFKVWSNGIKEVIKLQFSDGSYLKCTLDHKLMLDNGEIIEAKDSLGKLLFRLQDVTEITKIPSEEVYDFNLNDETHWGIVEDVVVHNCEISLKPFQFCNLVDVNVSNIESQEDLNQRVTVASFFGTLQAGFTDFHYLRPIWKETTEEDALVGVGMTGIASGEVLKYNLTEAANIALSVNKAASEVIGINSAARVCTIKPSGTSSCVLGTSSGIHAWYDEYYIRTIRILKSDPLATYLSIYYPNEYIETDVTNPDQYVVSIPQKAPEGSILRTESALDLLERIKKFNIEWVKAGHRSGDNTNNVSATVSMKDNEWKDVGEWMWKYQTSYNGLSVLPYDNGTYKQAPFQSITKEKYEEMIKSLKDIDLTKVVELNDNTNFGQEAACAGGLCSLET